METNTYRRAAIVIGSLDRQSADDVLERLPAEQAQAIRDELISLDGLRPSEQEAAIGEFLASRKSVENVSEPRSEATSLPPASAGIAESSLTNSSLKDLLRQDEESIACAVIHERTSVVAALIGALPSERAAAVLRLLPAELQSRVVVALHLGVVLNMVVVDIIADQICDKQAELETDRRLGLQHRDALQAIFDELSPEERVSMLRDLEKENPMLVRRLVHPEAVKPNDCYC